MAKLERNRVMFFGSWTGADIAAAASAKIGDSTGITAATVTVSTFGTKVLSAPGEYTFVCTTGGASAKWALNDVDVDLEEYGISPTGTAAIGDIIVVTYNPASSGWEALGKDNDDLSKELNPDTETSKNVLGEATFIHSGYEVEVSIEPYYIDPSRKMYARIRDNAIGEKYGGTDLIGYFAEAHFETANPKTRKMTGYCMVRQAWYVPQSVGGDTSGYAIPVNVYPFGAMTRKDIVYDMATNEATITDQA